VRVPARAFIVAIQKYSQGTGLKEELAGTHDAAREFYRWLTQTKTIAASDIFYFADDDAGPNRRDATAAEILKGLRDLVEAGADNTPELYFFFSGHGFFFTDREVSDGVEGRDATDVLVASDYESDSTGSLTCINFSSVQAELQYSMGPGDHYYFVDACRNNVSSVESGPGAAFKAGRRSKLRRPDVYTLHSTQRGKEAPVASGFGTLLIDALRGTGRAKMWDNEQPDTMVVLFDSVKRYLKKKLPAQEIDVGLFTGGDGKILVLHPAPRYQCQIRIANASVRDTFSLSVSNPRGQMVIDKRPFVGQTYEFSEPCDGYQLAVTHPTMAVEPSDNSKGNADLYENCIVQFEMKLGTPAPPFGPEMIPPSFGELNIEAPSGSRIEVRNLATGDLLASTVASFRDKLPGGAYRIRISDSFGATLRRRDIMLDAGRELNVNLKTRPPHPLRDAILSHVPHTESTVDFSESLGGPMADDDPALWLSVMGASRIVGDPDSLQKLQVFELERFEAYRRGDSPIYVLAGFAAARKVSAAVGSSKTVRRMLSPVRGVDNLYQYAFKARPGSRILWLYPSELASIALATVALPNRATFIVLAEEELGKMAIRQFILPIYTLQQYLPQYVQERLAAQNPLATVHFIARAQRDFARYREIAPSGEEQNPVWRDFLYEKWTDPVLAIIGAYELIRRGAAESLVMEAVVRNLRQYFSGIPDTEALAKLADLPYQMPSDPPILLEGYFAIEEAKFRPPFPREKLDFRGPWTTWRAAEVSTRRPRAVVPKISPALAQQENPSVRNLTAAVSAMNEFVQKVVERVAHLVRLPRVEDVNFLKWADDTLAASFGVTEDLDLRHPRLTFSAHPRSRDPFVFRPSFVRRLSHVEALTRNLSERSVAAVQVRNGKGWIAPSMLPTEPAVYLLQAGPEYFAEEAEIMVAWAVDLPDEAEANALARARCFYDLWLRYIDRTRAEWAKAAGSTALDPEDVDFIFRYFLARDVVRPIEQGLEQLEGAHGILRDIGASVDLASLARLPWIKDVRAPLVESLRK
jgi:hypothetical protein